MRGVEALIGRSDEAQTVAALLADHPLVTIVGPGGMGKTTLATALADDLDADYPGGAHVVELATATDSDDVSYLAARQLGVDTVESFLLRSADRAALVVLDNCETAIEGAADVVERLQSAPSVSILATSRQPLRTSGERVFVLDPLTLPGVGPPREIGESPAARLFIARAREAGATWDEDETSLAAVARVVRRLDGLPLAIELAAARSRVLTPVELVTHLDAQLDVLARPGDDGRHGSLRRAIETSYVPLDEGRRTQLQRLSTIPGSFDLRLAHRIAPAGPGELDTLDALSALVDSSLVDSRATADGHTHYRLLDTIRAYALEQLEASGKLEEVQEDFVSSMVDVADEILAEGMKHFSSALLERIRDRFPHLVAAIDWCLERDETADRAYRLILPFYGPTGARSEAAHLARRVAARWEGDAPLKPEALAVMATVTFVAADYDSGRAFAQAAIDHPDASDLARVIGYRTLGMIAATDQELETAKGLFERGLEAASGIEAFARELRISWAGVAIDESDREEVSSVLAELVAHARGTDEAITLVWAMVTHAVQLAGADDFDGAEAAAAEAQDAAARSGVPWATSTAARVAGSVAAARGETERSIGLFRRSLEITAAGGDMEGMAMTLRAASGAAVESGDLALAEALWATIPLTQGIPVLRSITHAHEMALQERLGRPRGVDLIELSARARSLLGGEVAAEATAAGEGVIHRFERCELDVARHELRCDGAPVHVEPQVYDVLRYLVERAGQLVTKHDLMDNVWGDRFVSEAALSSRIAHARKAVGDDGKQQRVIKTVHGRGFTFVADVK